MTRFLRSMQKEEKLEGFVQFFQNFFWFGFSCQLFSFYLISNKGVKLFL